MLKKTGQIINIIVGWGIYLTLIAGGLTFFAFLLALLIGGGKDGTGQIIAVFLQKKFFPVVIRAASFTVILGLIGMYINKQQALSLKTDKADADKDIMDSKKAPR
jgi:hypothetical protein